MNTHHITTKGIKSSVLAMATLTLGLASCSQLPVLGQSSLPGDLRMNGKQVEAAFELQRSILQQSSAAIYKGTKPTGYGVVMSQDGYILTKRSELYQLDAETKKMVIKQDLTIIIGTDRYKGVRLVASDIEWDLAIIKVEAKNLTPIQWADSTDLEQGSWVITNGSSSKSKRRVNIGVISAHPREIKGDLPVMLGVGLLEKAGIDGVEISQVSKGSGADAAGILPGDIIKKLDGADITTRAQILDIIREKQPGDYVEVEFLRNDKLLKEQMELKPRKEVQGDISQPQSRNDQMSGDYSDRRNSFPMALQHDIDQNSRQVGGPLLTLDGKAVGINIARVNRAESYAIPAKEAQQVYKDMLKTIQQ